MRRHKTAHTDGRNLMYEAITFTTLSDAIRAGFQIYDRTPQGFAIRMFTRDRGWRYGTVKVAA